MSSLYNLEPQPTAKAILKTTSGDLSFELFAKQTPLACRNFLQHCLDGYYNNTIFHRVVPGFILQGGDPTGTGSGGISAINSGDGFPNEFHSRLKFNRRGLLGVANEDREDSNGSQFFFTLGATPELQGKNTMFGRIEGDTIYNLMKIADAELVENSETPLYHTKITGAEVLLNPFDDMAARVKEAPRTEARAATKDVKKRKKPAGKNVLSFGADEGDVEADAPVFKKAKANPKLLSAGYEEPEKMNNTALPGAPKEKKTEKPSKRKSPLPSTYSDAEAQLSSSRATKPVEEESSSSSPEPERTQRSSALEKTNAEIAALKASMKRNTESVLRPKEKPKNALEAMIPVTSTRGRKRGKATDEKGAIDLFKSFKRQLEEMPVDKSSASATTEAVTNGTHNSGPTAAQDDADDEADLCDLHFIANCQSCASWDDDNKPDAEAEDDAEGGATWMSHQLSFAKDTLGKDLEWKRKMEEIEVIDPREKARTIKQEGKKERDKRKEKTKS